LGRTFGAARDLAVFGIPTLLRSWPPRDDIPATI
jgi:hypothetical protein